MSSGIEVQIDADAINGAVTQAIVDSMIGEQMKKAINEQLSPPPNAYGRQSVVQTTVAIEVQRILQEMLREEPYLGKLRAAIEERMTDDVLDKVTGAAMEAFLDKLNAR
jgi:hypothetical protein